EQRSDLGVPCSIDPAAAARAVAALPFEPTAAQRRVMAEIAADLAETAPMNRLLQGDVGSGKTAVAFAALAQVAAAGRQCALMAPTEILAEQHFRSLSPWCKEIGIEIALLTASMPRAIKSSTLTLLAAGKIDCVVGTHALLSEGVAFADLALAIVDEQHRFGVAQRVRLRAKGESGSPHLLVMTATPIPRTLALTAYGDLDVSIIDELPPGREPPETRVSSGKSGRARAYRELRARLGAGDRGYLVCPMVEPGEDEVTSSWADTLTASTAIREKWPEVEVAVVHGRMSSDERGEAMHRFRTGAAQLLVATTVIEVGVDVPEATAMLIEDADRFGLSQLHQLRGRVGRGGGQAVCLLVTRGGPTSDGAKRLKVMGETCDGFVIAEADLEIRGPGELLGARQSGLPKLRFGDLARHNQLLRRARREAEAVLARDPLLAFPEHQQLRATLESLEGAHVYGAESG
ncbi:MAG: ATP-dependent DNA helicase RecG, partial [Deltaproteobacteria bacterium]|nr:ATP-dependent DNA helicase RecG [Deltaproteobacteria bacterium]